MTRKIEWSEVAQKQLETILEYLMLESESAQVLVALEIDRALAKASEFPEMYKADLLKKYNNGSFRVLYVFS